MIFAAIADWAYPGSRGNPGVRRLWAGLVAVGYRVSKKRVRHLMKAAGRLGRHIDVCYLAGGRRGSDGVDYGVDYPGSGDPDLVRATLLASAGLARP